MSLEETAAILEQLERYKQTHRLEYYGPYDYQKNFHNVQGLNTNKPARQKALIAANQIGKCVSIRLNVSHPDGSTSSVGELFRRGKPFKVIAWNGRELVEAVALPPFKKKPEPIYRVYLESGDYFECAGEHRVLGEDGWQHVSHFLASAQNLPESIWERVLSVHAEDVLRWFERLQDSLAGCLADFRSCGARLHLALDIGARTVPLPVGVQERTSISLRKGDLEGKCKHSHPLSFVRRANSYAARRSAAPCVASLFRTLGSIAGSSLAKLQGLQRRAIVGVVRLRLAVLACRGRRSISSLPRPVIKSNKIIAYSLIGCDDIYDFTVPKYENYFAAGVIHHNTTCGSMEVAMHLTGIYPKWWQGTRFTYPNEFIVASTTNETTRDRCQKDLFGDPLDEKQLGTGAVPLDSIGERIRKPGVPNAFDAVLVRHASGGWSKAVFRAYEQGAKKFMGSRLTGGYWGDEEPPADINSQLNRGIFATNGIGILTLTPEEGMTEVVAGYLNDPQIGQAVVRASWDDAPHMTPERRELALAGIPAHERDMRSKGEPLMGSGRVFDVPEDMIRCDPFEIPPHWARINGLDFGWAHPCATANIAVDRDKDAVYIYDGFRASRVLIPVHAAATKANGDWIPCAWPHDGLQHDKQSGKIIADLYRDCGVNMWKDPFTNPPAMGMKEGQGGNGVEAGIFDILEMMQTGRFKVFSTVKYWWEEQRMYHRKDGKIVPMMDDFISSVRVGVMFRRHAQTKTVRQPKVHIAQGLTNW